MERESGGPRLQREKVLLLGSLTWILCSRKDVGRHQTEKGTGARRLHNMLGLDEGQSTGKGLLEQWSGSALHQGQIINFLPYHSRNNFPGSSVHLNYGQFPPGQGSRNEGPVEGRKGGTLRGFDPHARRCPTVRRKDQSCARREYLGTTAFGDAKTVQA